MLKDYLDNLQQLRQSHPISQADYESWRHNIITKQLFEDLESLQLDCSNSISAYDSNTAGLQAAKLNGVQDTVEFARDWMPDCLEVNDNG